MWWASTVHKCSHASLINNKCKETAVDITKALRSVNWTYVDTHAHMNLIQVPPQKFEANKKLIKESKILFSLEEKECCDIFPYMMLESELLKQLKDGFWVPLVKIGTHKFSWISTKIQTEEGEGERKREVYSVVFKFCGVPSTLTSEEEDLKRGKLLKRIKYLWHLRKHKHNLKARKKDKRTTLTKYF